MFARGVGKGLILPVAPSHFVPQNESEHERGNSGENVQDYCLNCSKPFMSHANGICPR